METFSTAQNAMRHEAENDQSLLMKAKDNAKVLLEKYIIGLGKEMGVNYSVKYRSTNGESGDAISKPPFFKE